MPLLRRRQTTGEVSTDATTAPRTQSEDHNIKHLFQARDLLLRILENSCGILKAAIGIFEKHQAQHYRRYIWLREQFGGGGVYYEKLPF